MASRRTSTSEGHAGIHWQANYLQQPATDSPHAATTRVEPHRAAADAALARQNRRTLIPVTHSSDGVFTPLALDQRPFYRLLDEQLLAKTSKTKAVSSLSTLVTLLNNILDPPEPSRASKYRSIRLRNSMVDREVVQVPGAYDLLVEAGFRRTVEDFEPYLVFPPTLSGDRLYTIRTAQFILCSTLDRTRKLQEEETRRRDAAKEEASLATAMALIAIEDDRERGREGARRKKEVREARMRDGGTSEAQRKRLERPFEGRDF